MGQSPNLFGLFDRSLEEKPGSSWQKWIRCGEKSTWRTDSIDPLLITAPGVPGAFGFVVEGGDADGTGKTAVGAAAPRVLVSGRLAEQLLQNLFVDPREGFHILKRNLFVDLVDAFVTGAKFYNLCAGGGDKTPV